MKKAVYLKRKIVPMIIKGKVNSKFTKKGIKNVDVELEYHKNSKKWLRKCNLNHGKVKTRSDGTF